MPQTVGQLPDILRFFDTLMPDPEQIIEVPKILPEDVPVRTAVRDTHLAEQLVEVLVLVPSFSDWVRWKETYRRTGHTWLGGFDSRLIPSRGTTAIPGRKINAGQGPRRPWYHAASVPAVHRQSGGNPWLRLSRQLRTVQKVQFWGVSGAG